MGLLNQAGGVVAPGEVLCKVYSQVPVASDDLHSCSSDVQRRWRESVPPEVQTISFVTTLYMDVDKRYDLNF